jgi:hypothetical protein
MAMNITISRPNLKRLTVIAAEYECDARALVEIAIEELIAAHEKPKAPEVQKRIAKPEAPRPPVAERTGRSYAVKACADCGNPFHPSGPRAKRCDRCRTGQTTHGSQPTEHPPEHGEVVWNGSMGRRGASLTGNWNSHRKEATA